jgi:hypothetical protein
LQYEYFKTVADTWKDYAPIFFNSIKIGRGLLDPDLGSGYNFKVARKWLSNCREKHESCLWKKDSLLPTRVIEISLDHPPRLVLSNGTKCEYGALSHCWGGEITHVLTTETLEDFQNEIKITELPANFADAILIAGNLGLKYIWIDSLCILQDSREDWEIESGKMGSIYRNSTVTIAALTSPGSKHGILSRGEHKLDDKMFPTIRLSAGSGFGEQETVMLDFRPKTPTV